MSLSNAMTSTISGLTATARQTEVLSSNVANATTPGYARREVALNADINGLGVKVTGVLRTTETFVESSRRTVQSEVGYANATTAFMKSLENIIGTPEDDSSLVARVSELEAAFIAAASRPESQPNLIAAVNAAKFLTDGLNEASNSIQNERVQADKAIQFSIDQLNFGLSQIEKLNSSIQSFNSTGRDISALLDQRSQVIDSIASLIPLREIQKDNNQIVLISTSGAVLLDGKAAVIGFKPTSMITAEMTVSNGALSGLTLNNVPLPISGSGSLISGGALGALFDIRDRLAVEGQARLDAMARDMIERVAEVDPTIAAGMPSLFTDSGSSLDPTKEVGLAARINVNQLLDGARGGSALRLRDGLAGVSGAVGNATLLLAYTGALSKAQLTSSTTLSPSHRSLSGMAADVLSLTSVQRLNEEKKLSFANTRLSSLQDLEKINSVDLDREIQSLIEIEKIYAANSKVLQTISDMLDELLRI